MKVQFEFAVRFGKNGKKVQDMKAGMANPYMWDPMSRAMDVRYSAWR